MLKTAITLMVMFVVVFNGYLIYHYVKLHTNSPFENFKGSFISPISLSKDNAITGTGTYDRDIMCRITNFDIHLKNSKTSEEVVIGPSSLLVAPPVNLSPGTDIPIEFVVAVPSTLYPGTWSTVYHGSYHCRAGIFVAQKAVTLNLSSLVVTE